MNLKEGTRRLALVLGVAGAIGAGFGSYLELREVLAQRASHDKFEQLANLGEVQKERKCRLLGYDSGCFRMKLPPGAELVAPNPKVYLDDKGDPIPDPGDWQVVSEVASPGIAPPRAKGHKQRLKSQATQAAAPSAKFGKSDTVPVTLDFSKAVPIGDTPDPYAATAIKAKPAPATDPYAAIAEKQSDPFAPYQKPLPSSDVPTKFDRDAVTPLASEMNTGGIKAINWTQGKEYGVASIDTEEGQLLYPTPVPSRWLYLFAALLPLVGFLIPWGAIRAIGWVGAGFVSS